jgi:DnaJ-domain-containing protein 1
MSIPTRLYRIAKYKLTEIKDRLDQLDEEQEREAAQRRAQTLSRADARRELDEAMTAPPPETTPAASPPPSSTSQSERPVIPDLPPLPRRTPEEIARGSRPLPQVSAPPPTNTQMAPPQPDPLTYHYRLLGVEPGTDFGTVQAAYNTLAARSDPGRFPAGSEEERTAQEIRKRLEASYQALRDALDPTARRFDLLEY